MTGAGYRTGYLEHSHNSTSTNPPNNRSINQILYFIPEIVMGCLGTTAIMVQSHDLFRRVFEEAYILVSNH